MSRYQELATQTEKLIADGVLRPGDRLPSVRQACRIHDISPVTVTQAYYLLENRGLIEARPKSGYFVRARLGESLPEPEISRPAGDSTELQVSDFIFQILDSVRDPSIVPLEIPSHPREGISLTALEDALKRHPIKACLFMLNFANPTGSQVSDERKLALLELLRRHDVPLIEDDVYAELHFGQQAPLSSKAGDRSGLVMHVSSFSKCLAPGYRIGWVAAGRYASRIQRQKLSTSLATTIPVQIALADYLKQGGYENHLRHLRQALAAQEAALVQAIERHFPLGTRMTRPQGGYFLWLQLPPQVDTLLLHQQALNDGISIAPGPIFSAKREFGHHLRLNFGHPDSPRLRSAMATLGELISRQL